ncbi:Uma2 family endonuclease [Haloimpatiens massiliensis]|uniref:Uma2 family endonuclease n=1 Tax=Haloimpatiens massiliensis TaxID=1658110 RepID=UPI0015E0F1BE|nr:Uma2 family endonuclease [Haloimpatiens massiliensis]
MINNTIQNKIYTYADYKTFPENEPIEIIEGEIYNMAPAPSRIHQKLINELSYVINHYIKSNNGPCELYTAPFDVLLKNNNEPLDSCKNVVQPDISVICDKNKLTDKGCTGAPNMIIEIVSPYNPSNDYIKKAYLYEKYGVSEYWIVNPINKTILVYNLDENKEYGSPEMYNFTHKIKVNTFNNLDIDFNSFNL